MVVNHSIDPLDRVTMAETPLPIFLRTASTAFASTPTRPAF
jgi:hypothetical protein